MSYNERALDSGIQRFEILHVVDTRNYKKPQLKTLFGLTVSDSRSSIVFTVGMQIILMLWSSGLLHVSARIGIISRNNNEKITIRVILLWQHSHYRSVDQWLCAFEFRRQRALVRVFARDRDNASSVITTLFDTRWPTMSRGSWYTPNIIIFYQSIILCGYIIITGIGRTRMV